MASDLEASLVDGGISPAAAKTIANAIQNAATAQVAIGRRYGDATPRDQLRMVSGQTRKYLLQNLDYSGPSGGRHPYDGSQPATAQGTLSTPAVKGKGYINVSQESVDSVQQAQIDLNVEDLGGQHARMNPRNGAIETVPLSVEIEPKGLLEAEVSEESGRTVIKIALAPDLAEFLQTFKNRKLTHVVRTELSGTNVKLFTSDGGLILDKNNDGKPGLLVYT